MKQRCWRIIAAGASVALVLLAGACSSQPGAPAPSPAVLVPSVPPSPSAQLPPATPTALPRPVDTAPSLPSASLPLPTVESTPYPYTTPLPPLVRTVLDGVYTKFDPTPGTPVPCRRCPEYKPEGGEWTLWFDKGIFRVFYKVRGWRTVGSFTVSGDRLELFNDPTCHTEVGVYTWKMEGDALILQVVDDPCAIGLRAKTLTAQPWLKAH